MRGETYFNKRKKNIFWENYNNIYYELFTRSLVSGVRNKGERVFSIYVFDTKILFLSPDDGLTVRSINIEKTLSPLILHVKQVT